MLLSQLGAAQFSLVQLGSVGSLQLAAQLALELSRRKQQTMALSWAFSSAQFGRVQLSLVESELGAECFASNRGPN